MRHDFVVAAVAERNTPGAIVASIPAGVNPDGTFTIVGVVPGRYTLMAMAVFGDQQWSVAQAIADGRNVIDQPLEVRAGQSISGVTVVMTDRRTELTCTVQDASGALTTAYPIAVVPADPALRRVGSPRLPTPDRPSTTDGRYVVTGLPPGDYLIFALADLDADAWKAGIWPEFDPARGGEGVHWRGGKENCRRQDQSLGSGLGARGSAARGSSRRHRLAQKPQASSLKPRA